MIDCTGTAHAHLIFLTVLLYDMQIKEFLTIIIILKPLRLQSRAQSLFTVKWHYRISEFNFETLTFSCRLWYAKEDVGKRKDTFGT